MKWLLDTNVVSEGVRDRPDPDVLTWLASRAPEQLAVSIVTVAELRVGISSAPPGIRSRRLVQWLDDSVLSSFEDRILPVTSDILIDWLKLARALAVKGTTRDAPDLLVASTARIHELIIVTRNIRDFAGTGVLVYNPWTGDTHQMDHS